MLYLVQHAEAKNADEDPKRDLSEIGVAHAQAAGRFLSESGIRPKQIWHSGKLRAEHTARIVAEAIGGVAPLTHEGLGPADDPTGVVSELVELEAGGLMIVGHLPYLERLSALLLAPSGGRSPVRVRNAGIIALARTEGSWVVEWSMSPELMQKELRNR